MSLGDPLPGRDLAVFVTAVETGTVQGAADALALTQSAATKRLQALERRVGRTLLERGSHGVRPTAAGGVLYPLAREALALLERAEAAVRSPDDAPLLRIQASRTIGETLLPEWLGAFRAISPRCRVSAVITNSDGVVHAVRDGTAEIGFVEGPGGSMHGLRELVVAHDEVRAVVARDHPWARRRAVGVAALTREPFLAREAGSGTRAVSTEALAAVGVELRPALEVSSAEGLKRAVLSGGFTLLSERVVAAEVVAGTLVALPVSGVELRRALRAVRRSRPALPEPARAFWRWLEHTIAPGA
ncbi:MAG TPA: LysR family transcriptional regulator [Solirubrobacteraceae bacterium]|jgi:DNA-binding transcriptional LysR family regulator|nr:LysR family transcriptional regulator [Solirubrobacteraceae bacterium]